MSLPILRRIDENDTESIEEAVADGFHYVEDLLTYELNVPTFAIHIRRGQDSDIRASIEIALKELKHSRLYADPKIPQEMAQAVYKDRVRHAFATAEVFVACAEPGIIGFAVLSNSEIELIVVDSRYQRCGVGRKLVDACIEACRANGSETLKVKTQRRNYRARSFYEKFGFSRTKTEKDFHRHGGGL